MIFNLIIITNNQTISIFVRITCSIFKHSFVCSDFLNQKLLLMTKLLKSLATCVYPASTATAAHFK